MVFKTVGSRIRGMVRVGVVVMVSLLVMGFPVWSALSKFGWKRGSCVVCVMPCVVGKAFDWDGGWL